MSTTIISNGSKWLGEESDSVEELLEVLATETLDPSFEKYGNFVYRHDDPESGYEQGGNPNMVRFFGNFLTISHVFNIDSDEPEVIASLTEAINHNKSTKAYRNARKALRVSRKAVSP